MRTITLRNIHKAFGKTPVLDGVGFVLSEGKRLAIVGENGAGKSTLLKILCKQLEADEGELFGEDVGCAYIAQDFSGRPDESPHQFLSRRLTNTSKAIKLLGEAAFELGSNQERLKNARCGDLSGGELKKLEIVAGLASGSLFIALDEPENHLDYQTIEWLIGELGRFRGGLIFISHDQYLVDALADTILELAGGGLTVYSMRYEEYLEEKVRHLEGEGRQWEVERKTLKRLHATVEMLKDKMKFTDSGVGTYRQTKRRYEEMKESHGERPKIQTDKPKVRLGDVAQKKGKLLVSIRNLSFSYEGKEIFKKASAELRFGEKIVLFGRNGSGKSTLLELITGELKPESGEVRIGNDVRYQIMTQDHLAGIDAKESALNMLMQLLEWDEVRARAALRKYGLALAAMDKPLEQMSGGQQARFKLALTFAQLPEFLILDEPTNHVDPPTWEAIVEAIKNYEGTVLAVTHDRAFIDAIADKLWVLEEGTIREHLGTLSEYINPPAPVYKQPDDWREHALDD